LKNLLAMHIHFIAIGGSAMHNLAIALKQKGYEITGSDDEIFEPSLSRLKANGLLPSYTGWNPDVITSKLDAVVLGMHARSDNPELLKAKELGLKIYSYPEYLYEQTKEKKRIVVGGSHGKTTTTAMIMHVLKYCDIKFDYMVGAQLDGFDNMVAFSDDSEYAVFEGDEYLTSPIDPRPKFHVYKPSIGIILGIAWDHINVFPTFEIYQNQFLKYINCIEPNGTLIYCAEDQNVLNTVAEVKRTDIELIPYKTHPYKVDKAGNYFLLNGTNEYKQKVFGAHNMQNISAALNACLKAGIKPEQFYRAISTFPGAAKRLQTLAKNESTTVFLDFAHSPSKVSATVKAVKETFSHRKLIACLELHTFSSLTKEFLSQYKNALADADIPFVFYNPKTIEHKKLPPLKPEEVATNFGISVKSVFTNAQELINDLHKIAAANACFLIMTSGNFSGMDLNKLAHDLCL